MAGTPLDSLTESYLDLRWHLDPVEGSGAGRSADDDRLGAFTDDAVRQHLAALRSLMTAVEELAVDDVDDEIDRTALLYHIRVAEHRFRVEQPQRRDPGFWAGHLLEALYQPLLLRDRDAARRAGAAAARLRATPPFVAEAQATLADCPRVLVEAALAALRPGAGLVDEAERVFGTDATDPAFRAHAAAARDAMAGFAAHLEGMLRGNLPDEPWGVGRASLEFRIAHQHALSASTEELLRYAGRLIRETETELATVARELGVAAWPDAMGRLRESRVAAKDLVPTYVAAMERARAHVEGHALAALPDAPLEVVVTPAYAVPWTPIAAYLPPGPLATDRTGRFFVTRPDDGDLGLHEQSAVAATAAHEGFPGHHLHLLSVYQRPRPVRRLLHAPVTIEGWATYGEGVMDETGFYAGPEERFARLVALLWRALRVTVDVGVHTGAMSYEAAIDVFRSRLLVGRPRAEAEVRRAYASPGSLMAYAVGRRELLELRARYVQRAEPGSALRGFHDALLTYGALPPSLVRWGLGLGD